MCSLPILKILFGSFSHVAAYTRSLYSFISFILNNHTTFHFSSVDGHLFSIFFSVINHVTMNIFEFSSLCTWARVSYKAVGR